jgi:hypothetical protein
MFKKKWYFHDWIQFFKQFFKSYSRNTNQEPRKKIENLKKQNGLEWEYGDEW